jgi:transcriptional regulator with XRE-family HTH domain
MAILNFPSNSSGDDFGRFVVAMRQRRKLKQATLAERAGISPCHLSNIEHARSAPPSEELARRFAQGMSLTLTETKTFVAEANLARSQWHAERLRAQVREVTDEGPAPSGAREDVPGSCGAVSGASPGHATAQHSALASTSDAWPVGALLGGRVGAGGARHGQATPCHEGAFAIAAQTVRLDIDLPRIGAACLEIDVSTEGSDCCLLMRVVPRTLERERRP